MELAEYTVFADKCFRDTLPPCAAVCPLAYDVREFIRLMQRGSVRSAHKLIRNAMIFPSIITRVCPEMCKESCVRAHLGDSSVDLKSLEQICVDKMAGKKPERFNIPQKQATAAVIGAGLSGLAFAYRFSSYGHPVTVYEKGKLLGGSISELLDAEWCHEELTREFTAVRCSFEMGTEIRSLSEITADVVYIATGEGGRDFLDEDREGVLRGGALEGTELMESVRQGLTAAEALENWLLKNRSGSIEYSSDVPEREPDERYYSLHYDVTTPAEPTEKGEPEAFRCMRCNCSECYDACPLMEKHRYYPKKMCSEVIITLKPNKSKRTGVRMIMGCTDCGACREVCPEHIDMGKLLQEARTDFYESGVMAPAFHDYWLKDMEFCQSDEARLVYRPDESKPADIMYFPGCQLSASDPEYTIRSYEGLKAVCANPALILGCCGVPAKWAGQQAEYAEVRNQVQSDWESLGKPPVVTACPSCLSSLKTLSPDMEVISYYHFASQHLEILGGKGPGAGRAVKVIDPCSSADEDSMADDVRNLLKAAGYDILNPEAEPACCGFGGHIYNAAPDMHRRFVERRIGDTDPDTIAAAYCVNCRDTFAAGGRDGRHVLGMIFGIEEDHRQPPELSQRRSNRRAVRRYFAKEELTPEAEGMDIRISDELIRRMDSMLILREQIEELISEAEESGSKLYDEEKDTFIAHRRFGAVTIWAAYSRDDNTVTLRNVYLHRMEVMEDV